jgi:hypothetical protein
MALMGKLMVAVLSRALDLVPVQPAHHWFGKKACVVEAGDRRDVFVGGTLIGSFAEGDRAERDVLLVFFCGRADVRYGNLAKAFGISVEGLREVRKAYEAGGLKAVISRRTRGGQRKVTARQRARAEKLFEQGLTIDGVRKRLKTLSRSTVGRLHREWTVSCEGQPAQSSLPAAATAPELSSPDGSGAATGKAGSGGDEEAVPVRSIRSVSPGSKKNVQHAGAWLAMGVLASMGVYELAKAASRGGSQDALRVALDALIGSLCIGESCAEGARRIATPTAEELLRASRCPSPAWVRTTIGRAAAEGGGARLHLSLAKDLIGKANAAEDRPAVFYIDNHVRPYSGQATIRKAWRMQDRRARPGITDVYVHDEDGRPVMKWAVPENAPLTAWLPKLSNVLQFMLGPQSSLLLAFDRGGSYPKTLALLRDKGVQFVTYEKKPYPQVVSTEFTSEFADGDEKIGVCESRRRNLKKGRGRVRRIALRMPDRVQVNLLTSSDLRAEELYWIMRGRWRQENAFKHGKERWGINQLDGRQTEPYPEDAIIPNPARRRLDHALKLARSREGQIRCKLAQEDRDAKRAILGEALQQAVQAREALEAQRPALPSRAPVKDTELSGKLVRHKGEYKMYIDTVRIALANAESELAALLGTHLARPKEAKMVLANLFRAPGDVRAGKTKITVSLKPAANPDELRAMRQLLETCEGWSLALPGDRKGRTLAFRVPD